MKVSLNQRGSTFVVLLLGLVVVAVVGLVSYRVINTTDTGSISSNSVKASSSEEPQTIQTKSDLNQAGKTLDNTNVDSSVNPSQLDSDLNSLL